MLKVIAAAAFLLIASTAHAQSMRFAVATYAAAVAADKATTLNCTLRPGCGESLPGYAWLDRKGGPRLQMAVSTSVDIASVWAWQKVVGKNHPKIAKAGLFGMAAIRGFVAARNYQRVHRSYGMK